MSEDQRPGTPDDPGLITDDESKLPINTDGVSFGYMLNIYKYTYTTVADCHQQVIIQSKTSSSLPSRHEIISEDLDKEDKFEKILILSERAISASAGLKL